MLQDDLVIVNIKEWQGIVKKNLMSKGGREGKTMKIRRHDIQQEIPG